MLIVMIRRKMRHLITGIRGDKWRKFMTRVASMSMLQMRLQRIVKAIALGLS